MNRPQPSDPRYSSMEALFGQLTAHIQAVDKDIGRALSEHDRQIHRERLDELSADRETVADYLDAIEREQPLPGPWPIKLRTSDLAVRAAVFTFGKRPVFHVPDALPPNYVPRPELLAEVRQALLSDTDTLALTSAIKMDALHGMGGIGKSVMARALCDDPEVQAAFPDGILWTTLGQTPELIPRLREWIDALGGTVSEIAPTADRLKAILADLLRERACLLIVDDAWRKGHAEAFRVGGPRCRLLLTTRDAALADDLGAAVHPVPVMTEPEAVELLEEWAKGGLQGAAAELKGKIVRRLGRLPLAIKLAGAQLQRQEAGQWLASFDARKLKARRVEDAHDSLEATFGLSLDELAPADRRLYVALAIFREDEPIRVARIARLWSALDGRDGDEVRELVYDLTARALVERSQADGDAINIHDLLRDFMVAELGDEDRLAAHRALLDAYRVTQQGVGWHTAPDDGYLYDHLTYHLDKLADHVPAVEDELYSIFSNQSWMLARVPQSGYLYDGYLADLDTVWRRAHVAAHNQIDAHEERSAVVDCVRFALIRSSVNSLAGNHDAALVARAIQTGLWPVERGLSMARLIPDRFHRANMLATIRREINLNSGQHEQVQGEALASVQAIRDDDIRAQAQATLLPQLTGRVRDGVLQEELAAAHTNSNAILRVQALTVLATQLAAEDRSSVINEVLKSAMAITDNKARALALIGIAPQLTGQAKESALSEGLAAALAISDNRARSDTLAVLAGQLLGKDREAALTSGLATARAISHEPSRVAALAALVPQLTGEDRESVLLEGLTTAQAISDMWTRATALATLIPHLTGLTREASLKDGLAAAQAITYQRDRAYALAKLIPHVTGRDRAIVLREGLVAAGQIIDERDRANVLAALAPELTAELLRQGFEAAQLIRDEKSRARVFAAISPRLTVPLLQEGLAVARIIDDVRTREHALAALASQLTGESVRGGLTVAKTINCERYRTQVLLGLAPHMTGDDLREGLAMARAIYRDDYRVKVLAALVPHLTGENRQEVLRDSLETVRKIHDTTVCAQVLAALVPYLAGEMRNRALKDGLAAAQAMDVEPDRAMVLAALAPHLNTKIREDALRIELELTRCVYVESERAQALIALAPHLAGSLLVNGLLSVMEFRDAISREQAMVALVSHLTDDVLQEVMEIGDVQTRVRAITILAPYLTSDVREVALDKALAAAQEIYWEDVRGEALIMLVPHLMAHQQDEALSATMLIGDAETRARVLTAMAPDLMGQLREVALREVLAAMREIDDEQVRAHALITVAPQLTASLLGEGLAVAQEIKDEQTRMETLLALESPLPDEDGQGTTDLFWPWQTVDLSDTRHWIIDHLRNDLINHQRIAVLEFCADQRHFAPSVLSIETLAAIAHHIIEICQEWEWL